MNHRCQASRRPNMVTVLLEAELIDFKTLPVAPIRAAAVSIGSLCPYFLQIHLSALRVSAVGSIAPESFEDCPEQVRSLFFTFWIFTHNLIYLG